MRSRHTSCANCCNGASKPAIGSKYSSVNYVLAPHQSMVDVLTSVANYSSAGVSACSDDTLVGLYNLRRWSGSISGCTLRKLTEEETLSYSKLCPYVALPTLGSMTWCLFPDECAGIIILPCARLLLSHKHSVQCPKGNQHAKHKRYHEQTVNNPASA